MKTKHADTLYAYISDLYAGNCTIAHIFIDNLYKVTGSHCNELTEKLLVKLEEFSNETGVKFTVTISADVNEATEEMKKYF